MIINHVLTVKDYIAKRDARAERRQAWARERLAAEQAAPAGSPEPIPQTKEDRAMDDQPKRAPNAATATSEAETAAENSCEKTGKTGQNGGETADTSADTGRDARSGQFRHGNPGGPGRPRRARMTQRLDELADARLEKIMAALLDRAEQGDDAATRFVLERR